MLHVKLLLKTWPIHWQNSVFRVFFTGHDAGIGYFQLNMRSKPIFKQKKRPPRANPRRSENPLFMRFINDYSMIVATLPEPTVLPPSRYQTGVLQCANGDFSCDFPLCPCSFWRFCYHGVITISLYLSTYLYLYYLKMVSIVEHTLN